jgi:hypothetical protein
VGWVPARQIAIAVRSAYSARHQPAVPAQPRFVRQAVPIAVSFAQRAAVLVQPEGQLAVHLVQQAE